METLDELYMEIAEAYPDTHEIICLANPGPNFAVNLDNYRKGDIIMNFSDKISKSINKIKSFASNLSMFDEDRLRQMQVFLSESIEELNRWLRDKRLFQTLSYHKLDKEADGLIKSISAFRDKIYKIREDNSIKENFSRPADLKVHFSDDPDGVLGPLTPAYSVKHAELCTIIGKVVRRNDEAALNKLSKKVSDMGFDVYKDLKELENADTNLICIVNFEGSSKAYVTPFGFGYVWKMYP